MTHRSPVSSRRCVRLVVALGLAVMCLTVPTTSALASQPGPHSVPASAVAMTIDCVNMTVSVHEYAVAHNYCPATSGHQILGTTYGDCGSSWLLMWDYGHNYADFSYGFQSSQGNVVRRNLGINWTNWSTGGSGSFGDNDWMNSSYYNTTRTEYTYSGFVTGSMSGWVLLWWGGVCTIIPPSDSTTVS